MMSSGDDPTMPVEDAVGVEMPLVVVIAQDAIATRTSPFAEDLLIDLVSAQLVLWLWGGANRANREMLAKVSPERFIDIAWKSYERTYRE